MFCSYCGNQLPEDAVFCTQCGAKVSTSHTDVPPATAHQQAVSIAPEMVKYINMKWHNFMIYFGLWAGAAYNLILAIKMLLGLSYTSENMQGETENISDLVYAMFDGLQVVDILFGALLVIIAALAIYTRFQLSAFRERGPKLLLTVYIVSAVWSLTYTVCVVALVGYDVLDGTEVVSNTIGELIVSVVAIVINYIYYNKRFNIFTR